MPNFAFAQTPGGFLLLGQGIVASSSPADQGTATDIYTYAVGNGYSGTTTGAFLSASWVPAGGEHVNFDLEIHDDTGGVCNFNANNIATPPDNFQQLTFASCAGTGSLAFVPTKSYQIVIQITMTAGLASSFVIRGGENTGKYGGAQGNPYDTDFDPYFAIVADGFQITPTDSSSGLFLSGAQTYCNSQFGSTSGIGATIANGFCVSLGYLFIPTADSLSQYSNLTIQLSARIPFSYFTDTYGILTGAVGSTTQNFPSYSLALSDIDFSSSTPIGPLLPSNLVFLSSTTIGRYLPAGMHDTMFFLAEAAIWVTVMFHLYHRIRPRQAKL